MFPCPYFTPYIVDVNVARFHRIFIALKHERRICTCLFIWDLSNFHGDQILTNDSMRNMYSTGSNIREAFVTNVLGPST